MIATSVMDTVALQTLEEELAKLTESEINDFFVGSTGSTAARFAGCAAAKLNPDEDTILGDLTDVEKRLALYRNRTGETLEAALDNEPLAKMGLAPLPPAMARLHILGGIADSALWYSIRERFNLWEAPSVGFRVGGIAVVCE